MDTPFEISAICVIVFSFAFGLVSSPKRKMMFWSVTLLTILIVAIVSFCRLYYSG